MMGLSELYPFVRGGILFVIEYWMPSQLVWLAKGHQVRVGNNISSAKYYYG